MTGSWASVQRQTTPAPRTASSNVRPGRLREATRTSRKSRTRRTMARCDWPCTPAPITASTDASGRASALTETAEAAPVRIAVMYVPSISASGEPSRSSNTAITALCDGSLPGKTETSLTARPLPGTWPGIAPTIPPGERAAMRGGTSQRPALYSTKPRSSPARSSSGSSSRSTSARVSASMVPS